MLLGHSLHTSAHPQEGVAHLECRGAEQSQQRPLLMSHTSAASNAPQLQIRIVQVIHTVSSTVSSVNQLRYTYRTQLLS